MGNGIQAVIEIGDPHTCQVARYATEGRSVRSVNRTEHPEVQPEVLEEFTVGAGGRISDGGTVQRTAAAGDGRGADDLRNTDDERRTGDELGTDDQRETGDERGTADVEESFVYGGRTVYRMERRRQGCICEQVESAGSIVRDVRAVEGRLEVEFLAPDVDAAQAVLGQLNDSYDQVHVRRLRRSDEDPTSPDTVIVDRGLLTDRQREVLATAYRLGYFEHPRDTSATEVADALDVTTATFTEHLAAAQRKLMDELL